MASKQSCIPAAWCHDVESSFLLSLPCSQSWLPFMSFSEVIRVWHVLPPEPEEVDQVSFLVVGIPGYNNLCLTFERRFWHIKDHFTVTWGPWVFVRFFLDSLEHVYLTKTSHILVSSYSSGLNNIMSSIWWHWNVTILRWDVLCNVRMVQVIHLDYIMTEAAELT